jgi:nitrate/nitrite transporter NarK
VFLTSAPGGFALGQLFAPRVASAGAWPANFLVVAAGAVVAVGTLEFAVRRLDVAPVATPASVLSNLASVRSSPAVLYGSVLAFAAYSVYLFLNSWLPTYLVEEFAARAALAGLLSAVFPAMGILSRAGGGLLSDRLLGGRRVPVLQGAFLVSVPLVAAVALLRSILAIVLALVVAGFVIQLTFGVVYSYVRESVATARTGTALSVVTSAGIAGAFSAPIVTGALIARTGGFGAAFGYAVVLALLGMALAWVAPEAASGE